MGYNMRGRGKRKEMTGVVLNNSMDKTVKMLVERLARHRKYKKYIKYRAKYLVHDPHNRCQIGDKVRIIESRPISKLKRWRVLEVLDQKSA
jgi:small subunit ribosomal protein S17